MSKPSLDLDFADTSSRPAIDQLELRRNPPRLLNFTELCILLDISDRTGSTLVADKKIPVIRIGGRKKGRLLFDTTKVFAALERMSA